MSTTQTIYNATLQGPYLQQSLRTLRKHDPYDPNAALRLLRNNARTAAKAHGITPRARTLDAVAHMLHTLV